jgi:hypothetical protein
MATTVRKVTEAERRRMVADAAYFRAERRGFSGGDPLADWLAAEAEIDARLREAGSEQLLDELDEGRAAPNGRLRTLKRRRRGVKGDGRDRWEHEVAEPAEPTQRVGSRRGE